MTEVTLKKGLEVLALMGVSVKKDETDNMSEVIKSNTKKIVIPESMSKLEAAHELERQYDNEEQEIDISANFPDHNWRDVLVAIKVVTEDQFGWIRGQKTFFGNPTELDVVTDVRDGKPITVKAFHGTFKVAAWEDASCGMGVRGGVVSIGVRAKKKFSNDVTTYYDAIRTHLRERSIFKGKSISVTRDSDGIQFEIFENIPNSRIILNADEELVVQNFILDALNEEGKRCFLFTGPYGNGKTETAMRVGKYATQNRNMSFFYLKDTSAFEQLLVKARQYSPCVVFMEDIDEQTSGEERDSRMNSILNTIDGVETKSHDLKIIFTTNHPEKINSALRRPGRIDVVINFGNPDRVSIKKIMDSYFEGIDGYEFLEDNSENKFPNASGAVIAEICKRCVKIATKQGSINDGILQASIKSMEYQIALMQQDSTVVPKDIQFMNLLREVILNAKISESVEQIREVLS